ncbi:MAG: phosphatidylserine decarboxylase [Bacteroidia bacterium]|nr:phosphatidylserine decarboxylase [Bacteroidia bacterium]
MKNSASKWAKSTKAYRELKKQIKNDEAFAYALQASLMIASEKAWSQLDADLYNALNDVFQGNGWPTTPEDYLDYIAQYLVLIPNEMDDPEYPDAWTSDDSQNGYNQKVYDLLCQFYFLVDQPLPGLEFTLQDYRKDGFVFADWLRDFAIDWGKFLDTPESFPLWAKASFFANPMYNMPLYQQNAGQWNSFNQFFYREFNGADKKGHSPLRPIAEPDNNNAIISPADCTYKMEYPIDDQGNVLGLNGKPTNLKLKHTHTVFNVKELLDNDKLAENFYGGTFVHYFLGPFDYHRFHSPISGKVKEIKAVQGKVFLAVNLTSDGQFDAPDSSEGGYEFQQARGVFVVDGGDPVGMVAAIPIGMAQVSGVDMYSKKLKGKEVAKGDEFGRFMFGGSDIIMLFGKNPDLYLWRNDPGHNPIHFQFGQVAAYWKVKKQN